MTKWKTHLTENVIPLIMLSFGEQLFTAVFRTKYGHYLLDVDDKSSRWKHVVLTEIGGMASKKLDVQIFWTSKINEFHQQL